MSLLQQVTILCHETVVLTPFATHQRMADKHFARQLACSQRLNLFHADGGVLLNGRFSQGVRQCISEHAWPLMAAQTLRNTSQCSRTRYSGTAWATLVHRDVEPAEQDRTVSFQRQPVQHGFLVDHRSALA